MLTGAPPETAIDFHHSCRAVSVIFDLLSRNQNPSYSRAWFVVTSCDRTDIRDCDFIGVLVFLVSFVYYLWSTTATDLLVIIFKRQIITNVLTSYYK